MDNALINKMLDLILQNEVSEIELVRKQREKLVVENMEIFGSNKYFVFSIDGEVEKVDVGVFSYMSVIFLELAQHLHIEAALRFRDGFIHSLEIYDFNDTVFDDISLDNIEIKEIYPSDTTNE